MSVSTLPSTATWHIDRVDGLSLKILNGSSKKSAAVKSWKAHDKTLVDFVICRADDNERGVVRLRMNQYDQTSHDEQLHGISNAFEFCR